MSSVQGKRGRGGEHDQGRCHQDQRGDRTRALKVTENPRHRFLLQAYCRHRFLEIAGHYEEIFAPEMMADDVAYRMHIEGGAATLKGKDQIKGLYRMWAETDHCIFYAEDEQVAVADNFVASVVIVHQQVSGKSLTANRALSRLPHVFSERILHHALAKTNYEPNESDMFLYTTRVEMIWPYDDRGRLLGEDVWEPDPNSAKITKLEPAEILTVKQAASLLSPLIKPLPSFDEAVGKRPKQPEAVRH